MVDSFLVSFRSALEWALCFSIKVCAISYVSYFPAPKTLSHPRARTNQAVRAGYWQRAIASRPRTAVRGYILGGFSWFAIPFGFASTLGLAAVALTDNPAYPTYPNPMTTTQVSSGLSAAFGAATLLGKNGAVALLITLFMAVTSSSSAQLIAVSSVLTFDVYKTYIKPDASPDQLIFVSHIMICAFGVVMATFACIWNAIGISLGWLFLVMGLIIGGAVFPAAFTLCWRKQSRIAAISGCLGGLAAGLTAWLIEAKVYYGELTITSTGSSYATLAGNMAGVLTGLVISVTVSMIKPDNFDWAITRSINATIEAASTPPVTSNVSATGSTGDTTPEKQPIKAQAPPEENMPTVQLEDAEALEDELIIRHPERLNGDFKLALILSTVLTFIMVFLVPMPMFFTQYLFSDGFFKGWVIISFLWVFFALGACGLLPVWETRAFWKLLFKEVFSKKRRV